MYKQQKHSYFFGQWRLVTWKAHIANILAILFIAICLSPISAPPTLEAAPRASNPIKHIVIMVKENRSFDSMFGTFPVLMAPRNILTLMVKYIP